MNLGDPVPGQVDLPQLRGVHEQPLGQRRDLVVPQGEDLESVESDERLAGDVPDLVRVETQELEAGLTGEGVVGDGDDVVVAQIDFDELR